MSFVVHDVLATCSDALKAKLAGPCNVGADRIVIWVTSIDRVNAILLKIGDFQKWHSAYFVEGVPRLCKAITQAGSYRLSGVGVAMEPGGGLSFGKSRTIPIFNALEKTLENLGRPAGPQDKEAFIREVIAALREQGIDPGNVHV